MYVRIYIYMYIPALSCAYVYMYVTVFPCRDIIVRTRMHVHMHMCMMLAHMCVYTLVYTCMCMTHMIHMHVYTHDTHACIHTCIHTCIHNGCMCADSDTVFLNFLNVAVAISRGKVTKKKCEASASVCGPISAH